MVTIQKISEEFSNGNSAFAEKYMADNILWHIAGDKTVYGKEAVIAVCSQVSDKGAPTLQNKTTITEGEQVVITGGSTTGDASYADVYRFAHGMIQEITSHFITTRAKPAVMLHAYLTFAGRCADAMTFYRDCVGGNLEMQSVADSPMADKMPAHLRQNILHATLTAPGLLLMGSDMAPAFGLIAGNSVSLMLHCRSEEEIRRIYGLLAAGGTATHPLDHTFWGAIFGGLTDKYGILWLLNYSKQPQ